MSVFLGMRGTGDWVTDQRPESWREMMLYYYPNGDAPLTAMSSMLRNEETSDPKFHWWTKNLALQSGDVTGVFTDPALGSAYTSGGVVGTVLYIQVAQALAQEFRIGHGALLGKLNDYRYNLRGKVVATALNGASSYVAVKLIQAANVSYEPTTANIANIRVYTNANPEGGTMPDVVAYDPQEFSNVTQIFRTPLSITRTARRTRLRTPQQYEESKREALELHSIEIEKTLFWGVQYSGIGANGKPERWSDGLINFIQTNAPTNVSNYSIDDTQWDATTWAAGGEDWLDYYLEIIYRTGSSEKMALCGSQVPFALKKLAAAGATINLTPVDVAYGIRLMRWDHQAGSLYFRTHPLFNYDPQTRRDMVIFEPKNIITRVIDDTFFVEDPQDRRNRNHSKDGTDEEFLTEIGWEYHFPQGMGYLSGFGLDNPA